MNRAVLSLLAILICIVLFFGLNIAGSSLLRGARADLTQGRLYTLSPGSKAIAAKLEEPIHLTFYLSQKQADALPEIKSYATRVEEFLREYAAASKGKIKLSIVNPEPFSETEDQANQAGLYPMPTGGDKLFFGLVGVNSTNKQETIPLFDQRKEEFLEYDLTRLVYLLSNPPKKTVGIMAWLPINGTPNNPMMRGQNVPPWQVAAQLGELFDTKTIATDVAEIPPDVKVLMVVHPKNISDKTQFAIDQFVLKGGRLLLFVDPWCESDLPPGINPMDMNAMKIPKASDLTRLMAAWGVEMLPERWAADDDAAIRVRGQEVAMLQYLRLTKDKNNFESSDSVSGELQLVHMDIAGVLNKKPDATTQFQPLLRTGPHSQTMDSKMVQFMPQPTELRLAFKPGDTPLTVAARVTGKVKTAFPDGNPVKAMPVEGQPPPADASLKEGEVNIIIVADCDMLADRFWVQKFEMQGVTLGVQKFADNGEFVIGAVDNLSGSSDLMSLRARGKFARPFDRVEDIQKAAEGKYLAKQKELQDSLRQAEGRISEMMQKAPQGGQIILTPEQEAEIKKTRAQVVDYRRQLRDVQHQLNKDIENLGTKLKILNIGVMPLAVGVLAVGLSLYRVNRRRSVKAAGRS
jgi:ABC-type uncharacterized transport system involved in gliding motility auxiliary subunit